MCLWHVQGGKALICLAGVLLPPTVLAESSHWRTWQEGEAGGYDTRHGIFLGCRLLTPQLPSLIPGRPCSATAVFAGGQYLMC